VFVFQRWRRRFAAIRVMISEMNIFPTCLTNFSNYQGAKQKPGGDKLVLAADRNLGSAVCWAKE